MPYANPDRQRAAWADAQARRRAKAKADAERADHLATRLARYRAALEEIASGQDAAAEIARAALEDADGRRVAREMEAIDDR